MKLSDNLIRIVSDAYQNLTPAEFLLKTRIERFNDENMMIKTLEVADLLSKLTEHTTTEAEKRFYNHDKSVEEYNKELTSERDSNPCTATIKEFLIGNGLVQSDSLEYIYYNLTKYKPSDLTMELIREDLDKTHEKLTELLRRKKEIASDLNITEIQADLTILNNKAKELYSKINVVKTNTKETNKSINDLKNTLQDSIQAVQIAALDKQDITPIEKDIKELQIEMNESINNKIKYAIEDQLNSLTETVIETIKDRLKNTSTEVLQTKTTEFVADKVEDMLGTLETSLETKIKGLKPSINSNKTIANIKEKVQDSLAKANNLEKNPELEEIVKDMKKLARSLDSTKTSNQEKITLIDSSLGLIKGSLNKTDPVQDTEVEREEEIEMDPLLDNIDDYFYEPNQQQYSQNSYNEQCDDHVDYECFEG